MGTIYNKNYNIDIYEIWDNNTKLYHVIIEKFDNNDAPSIGKNWVYVSTKEVYDLKKELKNNIEFVELLYNAPKNSKLEFVKTWELYRI